MAAPASSTWPGKLMMIGWPTPTVAPPFGTKFGVPNGAVPVNGVGFCPTAGPAATGTAPSPGICGKPKGGGAGGSAGGAATTPGSPGAWSGSARAVPVPRPLPSTNTNTRANPEAIPTELRTANRLPLVQRDMMHPSNSRS